ncbi:MAG: von Willebrand factor type A domain-containing protein [Akkermansiaceae bacterium]|nr:von Willebrand factor type A domain-containing protein [Akkermansiaceae bacterium]
MNDNLHTYIEPELEARITALVLGEASDFEVDELERLIKEKPELAIFHRRVEVIHEWLGDAMQPQQDEQWQLSNDRRAELKKAFSRTGKTPTQQPAKSQRHRSIWKKQIRASVAIAACLMLCLILFMMATPVYKRSSVERFSPEIVTYQASEAEELLPLQENRRMMELQTPLPKEMIEGTPSPIHRPARTPWSGKDSSFRSLSETEEGKKEDNKENKKTVAKREMGRSVAKKPSSPSSSMARVIASNTNSPAAVPVPSVDMPIPEPSPDFGNGEDFGDGWGSGAADGSKVSGGSGGGSGDESGAADPFSSRAPGSTGKATSGLRSGDFATTRNSIDAILNNPDRTAPSERQDMPQPQIGQKMNWDAQAPIDSNGRMTLGDRDEKSASSYHFRLSGEAKKARTSQDNQFLYYSEYEPPELPNSIHRGGEFKGGSIAEKEMARRGATVIPEHADKAKDVRKGLYLGEGYLNLGKYEEAEKELQEALRVDPYNKQARRLLEKVAANKSDYYRAAYDHTRAELLKEVDKAWEMTVPPESQAAAMPSSRPTTTTPSPVTPKALPDETTTAATPFSTFSLNVADVSFKLAKVALLENGQWPDAAKVRTEEFVNAFDYGDPSPRRGEPVACAIEQSAHPFLQQRNLLRVGMKTASIGRSAPLRLTILLDNSGSMEREDREASVLAAIQVLAAQLGPQDVITLVGFARQPRLLADRISGDKAQKLVEIVANTPSEGGTNIEEALRLARTLAKRQHSEGAQDRVVLITDGVANLGNTIPEELSNQIVAMRQEGIAFDACGVGAEGLNDDILEALTRKGDGRYYFLNRAEDADSGFAKQLAGALTPAAKNVKVQVKFNPGRVTRYRLLGFEKHRLKKEDFRNDKVDAAEMAAEEAGNAVYQIQVNPQGTGELGEVFVRFLDAGSGRMVERSWPLPYEPQAPSFDLATPSMQLAGTAAMLGEKLHGTDAGSVRFSMISNTLNQLSGHFSSDAKVRDLISMCRKVK